MTAISVAIVDDHPLLVEGVAALLDRWGGFTLAATGQSADDIVSIVETHRPNQMIVDLRLDGDAIEAISQATKKFPETRIIVFTASNRIDDALLALDSGASGYVLKGSPGEELLEALNAAQRDEFYITPSFATMVIGALQRKSLPKAPPPPPHLSVRDERIMNLLLAGKTNAEIANELSLSEKTVKGYMTDLMAKLNVRSRLEAMIAARTLTTVANQDRAGG